MTCYTVEVTVKAKKQIRKLLPITKFRIAHALEDLASDPYRGKILKANLKGLYSYRIGDYRIIYQIFKNKLIIQIIKVMHRRDVYR
mgnify:CR=1 FL=1